MVSFDLWPLNYIFETFIWSDIYLTPFTFKWPDLPLYDLIDLCVTWLTFIWSNWPLYDLIDLCVTGLTFIWPDWTLYALYNDLCDLCMTFSCPLCDLWPWYALCATLISPSFDLCVTFCRTCEIFDLCMLYMTFIIYYLCVSAVWPLQWPLYDLCITLVWPLNSLWPIQDKRSYNGKDTALIHYMEEGNWYVAVFNDRNEPEYISFKTDIYGKSLDASPYVTLSAKNLPFFRLSCRIYWILRRKPFDSKSSRPLCNMETVITFPCIV